MKIIFDIITKTIEEYDKNPIDAYDEGIVEGMIIIKQKLETKLKEKSFETIGVCGVCYREHPTYKQATECCKFAKGSGYEEKLNRVFELRSSCNSR
ncbi:MAG: hypothetical protein ACFFG0_00540 [Candidatus Thorarchaeota archaeon]